MQAQVASGPSLDNSNYFLEESQQEVLLLNVYQEQIAFDLITHWSKGQLLSKC